ncbi:glycosyltransferase family 2 protein [bacterium]|nr:glycosyltransferase family 2 protein [bacterium]
MISIIIPTRNRAESLRKVATTYYRQQYVDEVIIVDDCGDDETEHLAAEFRESFPDIQTLYVRHPVRRGAAAARISGYTIANNEFILFGEDDAWLDDNYTSILIEKLRDDPTLAIVSGRIIYLRPGEDPAQARIRFGNGLRDEPYLNSYHMSFNKDCRFIGDIEVPFTHALFLTRKNILQHYKYDPFYDKGNGFREETDYQLNVFTSGLRLKVTCNTYCYHMHREDIPTGGQRITRLGQLYWNIFYTSYMYDKYFEKLRHIFGIRYSKNTAKIIFASHQFYNLFLSPFFKLPRFIVDKLSK